MGAEQRKTLIEQIQAKRGNSRLICCLTSDRDNARGQIAKDFLFRFFQHLRKMQSLEKLDVLLFTLGGDTLAAYALARLVRQFAKKIGLLVPHMCLSGGTLFALAADEIVMTKLATLSAIDPSIAGPNNPVVEVVIGMPGGMPGQKIVVPVGVESVAGFKKVVREEWDLSEEGTAAAFNLLAGKVNPLLLGDLHRSKEQIIRLATTLMKLQNSPLQSDEISRIVTTLATELGSHDYLFGKKEARDEVKLRIADDDDELENLILQLYEDFAAEMELGTPFNPLEGITIPTPPVLAGPPGQAMTLPQPHGQLRPQKKTVSLVMIESLERSDVWEQEFSILPPAQVQIVKNHWRK
jgi:hypothetical protein